MKRFICRAVVAAALVAGGGVAAVTAASAAEGGGLAARLAALGGRPCLDEAFTCVAFDVPLDHGADRSPRTTVHFAVSLASGERAGTVFYAVGGPGFSGLALAQGYLDGFDPRLRERFDVVFFDQRGVGDSTPLTCPRASTLLDLAPYPATDYAAAKAAAKAFATDCVAEMQDASILPYVHTAQTVEDLEAFRQAIGAPRVWLYGESYGTQVAQQFATAHPEAVAGVVIDGSVDLTLTLGQFNAAFAARSETILTRVLAACGEIAACARDLPDPEAALTALLARASAEALAVDLPGAYGAPSRRVLTPGLLETGLFYSLYENTDRGSLLRALAAVDRGNPVPMLRLAYSQLGMDPERETEFDDGTWFGGAYYAVMCTDYGAEPPGGGDAEARADAIAKEADALAGDLPRLLRAYYLERMVCAYWPQQGPMERPATFVGGDYPTLILTADADPITPDGMAYAILDRSRNAWLVNMRGGPHVTFGRGDPCPDDIVFAAMIEGTLPEAREQLCRQDLVADYVPLTLRAPGAADEALTVAQALETELELSPEIAGWDARSERATGCDVSGRIVATPNGSDDLYRFEDCSFWPGLTVSGTAIRSWDGSEEVSRLFDLRVTGSHQGALHYRHSLSSGAFSLSGSYDGTPVGTPR